MECCNLCKHERPALQLSKQGICLDCLQALVTQIQQGGKPQKAAIEQIESLAMKPLMEGSPLLEFWSIDSICAPGQKGRLDRGLSKACAPHIVDTVLQCGTFIGSSGDKYLTTLKDCTCVDFSLRHLPCKHMLRLADMLKKGSLSDITDFRPNEYKNTKSQQSERMTDYSGKTNVITGTGDHFNETPLSDESLIGMTIVITGDSSEISRDKLSQAVEQLGGKISGSVSRKTNLLLVGENPGSKLEKAITLGVTTISIADFLKKHHIKL